MPNLFMTRSLSDATPHIRKLKQKKKNTALIMTFSQETHKKQKIKSLKGTDEHGNL
jgi:hypothetical protein